MWCVYCSSPDTKVVDSAKTASKVIRARACQSCRRQFLTEEIYRPEAQTPLKSQLYKFRNCKKGKERL